jgi:hypothetical protein
MKALKEKRLSLRSFLRRGLVILSLFALVFASCGESGDGEGGGPTTPVTPSVPYAVSIGIVTQPSADSFQGMPPDLTGLVLEVVWSTGSREFISGDVASRGFYAVPPYCDVAGNYSTYSSSQKYNVAHNASTTVSDELKLPGIIPMTTLNLTTKEPVDWYADQKPDFNNFVLQGYYEWNTGDKYNASATPNTSTWKNIPMSLAYPPIDTSKLPTQKTITVDIDKGGLNAMSVEISVRNYFLVANITYAGAVGAFFGFDDSINYSGLGLACGNAAIKKRVLDLAAAAKLNFDVTYTDGKPAKRLSWDEYFANVYYTNDKLGTPVNAFYDAFFFGDDGLNTAGDQLNWNDDDYTWTFVMKYVPKEYGNETYRGVFNIALPVYEFQTLSSAAKKYPGGDNVLTEFAGTVTGMSAGLLAGINDNWTLTANYERNRDTKSRTIGFTTAMFTDYGTASGGSTIDLRGTGELSGIVSSASGVAPGTTSFERNWPLPLVYRGEELVSDDETVVVDLFYRW